MTLTRLESGDGFVKFYLIELFLLFLAHTTSEFHLLCIFLIKLEAIIQFIFIDDLKVVL